jgi:competence protein ComEA
MLPPAARAETAGPSSIGWPRQQQLVLGLVLLALLAAAISEWWQRRPKPVFVTDSRIGVERRSAEEEPRLDLNQASVEQLGALPGIGPTLAQRIVAHRQQFGPFLKVEDLRRVPGIGPKTYEKVRPHVTIGEPAPAATVAVRFAVTDYEPHKGDKPAIPATMPSRPASATKMLPEAPLDINLASREELMRLPGIGPVLAERIVADRQANGPFRRVEDLTRIRGIKSRTLEKLRPYIFVAEDSPGVVRRAD